MEAELYAAEGTEGNEWDAIIREFVYLMAKRAISSTFKTKHVITHEVRETDRAQDMVRT